MQLDQYLNQDHLQLFNQMIDQVITVDNITQHYFDIAICDNLKEHFDNDSRSTTFIWKLKGTDSTLPTKRLQNFQQCLNKLSQLEDFQKILKGEYYQLFQNDVSFLQKILDQIMNKAIIENKYSQIYANLLKQLIQDFSVNSFVNRRLSGIFEQHFIDKLNVYTFIEITLEQLQNNIMQFFGCLLQNLVLTTDQIDSYLSQISNQDDLIRHLFYLGQNYKAIKSLLVYKSINSSQLTFALSSYRYQQLSASENTVQKRAPAKSFVFPANAIVHAIANSDLQRIILQLRESPQQYEKLVSDFFNSDYETFFGNAVVASDAIKMLVPLFVRQREQSSILLKSIGKLKNSEFIIQQLIKHVCLYQVKTIIDENDYPEKIVNILKDCYNKEYFAPILALNVYSPYLQFAKEDQFSPFQAPDADCQLFPNHFELECINAIKSFFRQEFPLSFERICKQLCFPALLIANNIQTDIPFARNGVFDSQCCYYELKKATTFKQAQNVLKTHSFSKEGIEFCKSQQRFQEWIQMDLFG